MSSRLYAIYGSSGCGRGIMPLAREQLRLQNIDSNRLVFVDDNPGPSKINDQRVLSYREFLATDASERYVVIAIAGSRIREKLAVQCATDAVQAWSVRAANTVIMDDVILGAGALLSPFVTLTSNIEIGRHFHANIYCYVAHDCRIGDFVTFAPSVKCNGNVQIEDYAYIGTGAVIRQGKPGQPLVIGKAAVVGMGAVVTKDVAPGVTVVGNPARILMK